MAAPRAKLRLKSPAGVCRAAGDTFLLTETAVSATPCKVLDMGTGEGYVAIELANRGFDVEACDVCKSALVASRENAARHAANVTFFHSDLWQNAGKYDLVLFNPPLSGNPPLIKGLFRRVPFTDLLSPVHYMLFGSFRRSIVRRFISGSGKHLRDNGRILMVVLWGELGYAEQLAAGHGYALRVVRKAGRHSIVELKRS